MWLDPRIQGRLRELLVECGRVQNKDIALSLEQAKEALTYAEQEGNEIGAATARHYLGMTLLYSGNIEEAIQKFTAIIEYAENAHELHHLAQSYGLRGRALLDVGELYKAENDLLTSIQLCNQYQLDDDILFNTYMHTCQLYTMRGRLNEAIATSDKVKTLLEKIDTGTGTKQELLRRSKLYELLGHISLGLKDNATARKYFMQSAEICLEIQQTAFASIGYENVGVTYFNDGDIDEAIEYTLKAIGLNYASNIPVKIHLLNNLAGIYLRAGDLYKAEITIDEALQLSGESTDIYKSKLLGNKGKILLARNNPKAIDFLLKSLEIDYKSGDIAILAITIEDIISYCQQQGDFKQAFHYQQELLQLRQKEHDEQKQAVIKLEADRGEQAKKIIELELQKSQSKLEHQERELTLTTSQLASQVDLLSHFRNDLREIVRGIGDPIDALRNIKQKLKELPCEQIDWAKFEADFVSVHPEFRSLLAERFPNLTAQEIKMCLLVRLGLKNAEIARLTCLSERTVDNHRFNLRKKLGIKTEQNLTQFLATIK